MIVDTPTPILIVQTTTAKSNAVVAEIRQWLAENVGEPVWDRVSSPEAFMMFSSSPYQHLGREYYRYDGMSWTFFTEYDRIMHIMKDCKFTIHVKVRDELMALQFKLRWC